MIPISTCPTTLSIEKTNELVKKLVRLKDQLLERNKDCVIDDTDTNNYDYDYEDSSENVAHNEIPSFMNHSLQNYVSAQTEFLKDIDDYLHLKNNGEKMKAENFEVVKTIIETCPEFLATKDEEGYIPCHSVVAHYYDTAPKLYVPLFAEVGRRHGVGGEACRGGLMEKSFDGDCIFESILGMEVDRTETVDALMSIEPPFFSVRDILDFHLLHEAILQEDFEMIQYLVELEPSSLFECDEEFDLPISYWHHNIHYSAETDQILPYLLRAILANSTPDETFGGLFTKANDGKLTLYKILEGPKSSDVETTVWNLLEEVLSSSRYEDLPLLHQTILYCPDQCGHVVSRFPSSVFVREKDGRLPIHVALDSGMKWSLDFVSIYNASLDFLKDVDPVTKMPPFVMAGMGTSCDLRTIYQLLRRHPEHIEKNKDGTYKYIHEIFCGQKRKIDACIANDDEERVNGLHKMHK
jgi:hypothetical protein